VPGARQARPRRRRTALQAGSLQLSPERAGSPPGHRLHGPTAALQAEECRRRQHPTATVASSLLARHAAMGGAERAAG